jgi:hypothetical protein
MPPCTVMAAYPFKKENESFEKQKRRQKERQRKK